MEAELARRKRETLERYQPLPKVLEWHKSDARVRLLVGGNRSGKTAGGAVEITWWVTGRHPYMEVPQPCKALAVENTWSLVADPMWAKLSKRDGLKLGKNTAPILPARLIKSVSWLKKGLQQPEQVTLLNGSTIDFRSADAGRPKFEGAEWDVAWLDEEIADPLVYQEIRRGLIDRGGKLIWTFTPLAKSRAALELHYAAFDPDSAQSVHETQISIYDNPHLNAEARDEFIATIPEDYLQTRIHGDFLILEGLVYGEWDRHLHEITRAEFNDFAPANPRIIVIDPGYAHPCAVLWAMLLPGSPRRVVLYREFYRKRHTVTEVARHIARVSAGEPLIAGFIDPASLKRDQSGAPSLFDQYAKALRDERVKSAITGAPLRLALADNQIEAGIYRVKEFLKPGDDGIPGLRAVEDLVNLKKELSRHRWGDESHKKDVPTKPVDRDNHLLDGIRYMLAGLPRFRQPVNQEMSESAKLYHYAQRVTGRGPEASVTIGG